MKLHSFKEFLFEAKKKDGDDVEVDVTKAQQAYYKDLPKSTAQKKKAQITKQADMDSDDPAAYKELPGDKKAQQQGKVKTSKYTDAYNKKYGKKNESVLEAASDRFLQSAARNLASQLKGKSADKDTLMNRLNSMPIANRLKQDELDKIVDYTMKEMGLSESVMSDIHLLSKEAKNVKDFVKKFFDAYGDKVPKDKDSEEWVKGLYMNEGLSINEAAKDDDGKADEKLLSAGKIKNPDIEKALKKKQEDTGVDIKILRAVMRKGMAAWKAGHRPGATQEQWGYARVNSFLTGGKTIGTKANPGPDGRLGKMAKLI